MKLIFVVLTTILVASKAQEGDVQSCHAHASETCRSGTDQWSTEGNSCNAVYGNINGNKRNLQKLMTDHLKQSFQFIVMANHFNSDTTNRLGLGRFLYSQSDKMWERAGKIMHFMLHRGAKASEIAPTLRLTNINPFDTNGEVKALAHTLTTLKGNAENIFNVHKHANNKRDHSNPNDNSYDPSVMHFLQEHLLEEYHQEIRQVSGHLNVLGRMAKEDSSRAMALHLFDNTL